MIRTVADLRRALDAYPDDMPLVHVLEARNIAWDDISSWYWHDTDADDWETVPDIDPEMVLRETIAMDTRIEALVAANPRQNAHERLLQSIASMEAGIRGMQAESGFDVARAEATLKHNRDWTAEDWATFDSLPYRFDHLDDHDEPDTLPGEDWGDYLHILYSSPLFEREWQNLINEGWTTITVEAWIDGDHGNICHVCGAMGAGWRAWTRAGGFEIITDKPDWIMANLDPTLKAYIG